MSEPLIIVGAGPVGSLLAIFLARRGFDVDMYERRPDIRRTQIRQGRSINLTLALRGEYALHQAGLAQDVESLAMPMYGRIIHSQSSELSFQPYGKDNSHLLNAVPRGELNRLLLVRAEQAHDAGAPGRVRIHFQKRLIDYDLAKKEALFSDENSGELTSLRAPVLFGVDGSSSSVRTVLERAAGFRCANTVLDSGYKELNLPPVEDGSGKGSCGRFALDPNSLHVWPREKYMLVAMPNRDGSFTCTLFLAFEAPWGEWSFAALPDAQANRTFFEQAFPDVLSAVPNLGELMHRAPLAQMQTVKVWPWSCGPVLLLGDSAHGIVPFFGQGMNAGFEDCTILDKLLEQRQASGASASIDWPTIFSEFAEMRKADTDAIADLAVDHFVELRHHVADPGFRLQKAVEVALQKRFPGRYLSRYVLVSFTHLPYRLALEAGHIQHGLLLDLCQGLDCVEQVDWSKAEHLLNERFAPFLNRHGVTA